MEKQCIICNGVFEDTSKSHCTKTCSKKCRFKHRSERRKKTNKLKEEEFNCKFCGKLNKRYRIRNGFCNRKCASKHYYNNGTFDKWKQYVCEKRNEEQKINYKMRKHVSKMVRLYLKKQNKIKKSSVWKALDYTPQQLKEHLEKQFDSNMSWDNYGTYWHIEHIIPQSKLIYENYNDENFKKCWTLENLRPLEAIENIKKGNKIIL